MIDLDYFWACQACEEHGEGPDSNRESEKHTRKALHPTRTWAVPHGQNPDAARDGGGGPVTVSGPMREVRAASAEGSAAPPAAEGDGVVHSPSTRGGERGSASRFGAPDDPREP